MKQRGFGLVELCVALVVTALLAMVALPTFRAQQLRSHRAEAAITLQRLQLAQEQYRERYGRYAEAIDQLPGNLSGQSGSGLYRIALLTSGPDSYQVTASAQGDQARDSDCTVVRLRVEGALSYQEPSRNCWPT